MRMAGSIACALLVSGCGPAVPEAGNVAIAANASVEQGELAPTETARTDAQAPPMSVRPLGNACLTQGGETVDHKLKALGTEPFWAAEVEGRCVTYKTPEDQHGSRLWTKVIGSAPETVWSGAFRGKQFELTVRRTADCSDGMSDKSYALEAVLRVEGEIRHGCAERL
jgi:uncharacterized membrane protein